MAKIACFNSGKGGVGKSLLCFNLAEMISQQLNKRCLIIDLDYQANLSSCYYNDLSKDQLKKSRIIKAFQICSKNAQAKFPADFKPAKINNKLSILTGSSNLDGVDDMMRRNASFAPFVLLRTLNEFNADNNFDYVLIDCHNNFQTLTQNALVVSKNGIFVPVNPGKFEIEGISTMIKKIQSIKHKLINPLTSKPFITGNLYFIGNKIMFNTKASNEFTNAIKKSSYFVASFHRRELFARALEQNMSAYEYALDAGNASTRSHNKKIVDTEITPELKKIYNVINK